MHYAPHVLLCCVLSSHVIQHVSTAKEPHDPELLRKFARNVESVLSPSLMEELQGARSNRSAVNAALTSPRDSGTSRVFNGEKPEIEFDNHVNPYHYERTYRYSYPSDSPPGTGQFPRDFYRPYSNDRHDPSYFRSELYNPYTSTTARNDAGAKADSGDDTPIRSDDPAASSGPPRSFAEPERPKSVQRSDRFPDVDFERFRENVLRGALPAEAGNHFGSPGDPPRFVNEPRAGSYGPDGKHVNGPRNGPEDSQRVTNSFVNDGRPRYLPPPFPGNFHRQDYQTPVFDNFHPSERFENLFGENFTDGFPPGRSFGGFYTKRDDYLPPLPYPESSIERPEARGPVSPVGPQSRITIPNKKPDESTPASASSSNYEVKLFQPAKDEEDHMFKPRSFRRFMFTTNNYGI